MSKNPRFESAYPFDYHFLVPKLICTEVWPVRDLVRHHHQVIFDVGASHGAWTKAWVDSFGPAIEEFHLFEPLPGNAEEIRHKLQSGFFDETQPGMAQRIHLNEHAVGEARGFGSIHFDRPTSGLASLAQTECVLPDRVVKLTEQLRVSVCTLDDYCAERAVEWVDLLKIDTEGFELNVLMGAKNLLEKNAIGVVLFEFGTHQQSQGHMFSDFHRLFTDCGYRMFQLGLGKQGWKKQDVIRSEPRYENFSDVWMFGAYLPTVANPG